LLVRKKKMIAECLKHDHNDYLGQLTLNLINAPIEKRFERITRLAKKIYNVKIAGINFLDEQYVWVKSIQGLDTYETSSDVTFCRYTVLRDRILTIPDALKDPRFSNNPYVINEPYIRFYAGYPLKIGSNKIVGTFCIVDTAPRTFSLEERSYFKDLGELVENEINNTTRSHIQQQMLQELNTVKRNALTDTLTKLWNRRALNTFLEHLLSTSQKKKNLFGFAILDIDNFKQINDKFGHLRGDQALKIVAKCMLQSIREEDVVGRWGGEEFVIMVESDNKDHIKNIAERVRTSISREKIEITPDNFIYLTVTIGLVIIENKAINIADKVLALADTALYEGKKSGKNKIVVAQSHS
jgi:diguanylate cyclase (GGDEF)-like protein